MPTQGRTAPLLPHDTEMASTSYTTPENPTKAEIITHPQTPEHSLLAPERRTARRTPGARRLDPKSPHILRAIRRATPRRRSDAVRRESDRDFLRKLSRRLAPISQPPESTPEATPNPTPKLPRPSRLSNVIFYPQNHDNNDESMETPPKLPYNFTGEVDDLTLSKIHSGSEEMEEELTRDSRRHSSVDTRRYSIEEGRRARPRRSSAFGFQLEDVFGDLGDVSFGADRMNAIINSASPVMQLDDGDSQLMSEIDDQRTSPVHRMSIVDETSRRPLDVPGTPGMVFRSDDTDDFRFEMPDITERKRDDAGVQEVYDEDYPKSDLEPFEVSLDPNSVLQREKLDQPSVKNKKPMLIAETGTEYPPFPKRVTKKLAGNHGKVGNEALNTLAEITADFFAQASGDLEVYARHAGRRTIEESDAIQLLRRQRLIGLQTTVFSLAQKNLPRELSQEIRMPASNRKFRGKNK
ncbi:centromere kinetochore component CENP-T-domain-containing protein [Pyronema omphalodes]|nr:centromere kinetochore component CENP-T-domain-containing protein [Pyronema omphalodes]